MDSFFIKKERYPSPNPTIDVFVVTYHSDGLRVKGYLAAPKKPGAFPGLLYLRGGIKQVGMARISRIVQFATHGFVVFAPFYRGNLGGEGDEDFGGHDRADAINAYLLLKSHEKVNEKIHVFGFSRGAVMALFVGINMDEVTSIVTWGGVSDMVLTYQERVDLRRMLKRVIGGTPNKCLNRYLWRTPLQEIDKIHAPVLLIHGKKDKHVSIEHAYRLEQELMKHKKKYITWYFNNYTHFFPAEDNRRITANLCSWMKEQEAK